ncbi:PfkB family carbohydrate kinase [Frankia sp. Ag45/Mut15]|uniref:PfkB family carbohydrate kinase n=1 Tax=Frankia umida TaxID=573489 RepID=A0ABT0JS44_9ACTN|nr:PfkB family carbohydrate kinase [Frankia umida]MCK9874372.1 PfkB family carbohydrate kinase [Frankia umida]
MRTTGAGHDGAEDVSECELCADNGVGAARERGVQDDSDGAGGPAGFLVAGGFVLDCLISTSGLPVWGDDLRADAMRTVPGGKALNQAITFARLGGRVAAVGSVGRDPVGEAIRSVLIADGVDVSAMAVHQGAPTPVCVVHSRPDGEKAVVWRVPDELAPTARTIHEAARGLGGRVGATVVTFEFPAAAAELVAAAAAVGRWVVVHPAPALPPAAGAAVAGDRTALLGRVPWDLVDVLVPNEAEARALLVGHPGAAGPARLLADALADHLGVPIVCVTLGARGCVLRSNGQSSPHRASARIVVDTTAASDAFTAVFTAQLVAGWSPLDAVHAAQRAAVRTVGRPGGYEALPTHAELLHLTDPAGHTDPTSPGGANPSSSAVARIPVARLAGSETAPVRAGRPVRSARSVASRAPV